MVGLFFYPVTMKVFRPKTEKWHNFAEGDVGKPLSRKGEHLQYYKKGFWKRCDRKKFFRDFLRVYMVL